MSAEDQVPQNPGAPRSTDAKRQIEAPPEARPGAAWADASDAQGSRRATPAAAEAVTIEAQSEPPAHEDSSASLVILLLEDESWTRRAAAATLDLKGYRVIEGQDAGEGISVLNAGNRVDVVFSDINMPGQMNGIAFAQWVAERHPGLPVLLTSAAPEYSLSLAPSALRGFIGKPYELDEVDRRLRRML